MLTNSDEMDENEEDERYQAITKILEKYIIEDSRLFLCLYDVKM